MATATNGAATTGAHHITPNKEPARIEVPQELVIATMQYIQRQPFGDVVKLAMAWQGVLQGVQQQKELAEGRPPPDTPMS